MIKKALLSKLIVLLLLVSAQATTHAYYSGDEVSQENTGESLQIWTSTSLYPMISSWVNEYKLGNGNTTIEVNTFTGKQISEEMLSNGSISFISGQQLKSAEYSAVWKLAVGRDILVPITNSDNPYLKEILSTGIAREVLSRSISEKDPQGSGLFAPTGLFSTNRNDELSRLSLFLDMEKNELTRITLLSKEDLIETVKNDVSCIGFCHLADIIAADQAGFIEGISLVPIDQNNNGTIDNFENIYSNLDSFTRGVWIGKYPHSLSYTIYSVASDRPENQSEQAFLAWILSKGQNTIADKGYTQLLASEKKANIASLYLVPKPTATSTVTPNNAFGIVLTAMIILVALVFVLFLVRLFRADSSVRIKLSAPEPIAFDEKSVEIPSGIFFNKNHSWAFMEKDGFVRVGIDDFLSQVTGPLTNIKLKEPGERIKKGDIVFSIIQQGKQLDIQSPVTGTIVKSNRTLFYDTALINRDPYVAGWVYEIEPLNWLSEIGSFMMGLEYTEWLSKEFVRLKDFLANCCRDKAHQLPVMIMQDGGDIKSNPLKDAGPLTWEEFQTNFIEQ